MKLLIFTGIGFYSGLTFRYKYLENNKYNLETLVDSFDNVRNTISKQIENIFKNNN